MRHHHRRTLGAVIAVLLAAGALSAQGRKVSGTVVEAASEQPVAGAHVLYEESGRSPQTTTTDSKGYFEFSAGRLGVVTVTARGLGTARHRWPPTTGMPSLRVRMTTPAILRGTVSDLVTGRPLSGSVRVIVQHPGNFVSRTATAERGAFEIMDLPPGPAVVTARSEGFAPFVGITTVEGGKVTDLRIGLLLEAQAAGQVTDAEGGAVTGAIVTATYPDLAGAGLVEGFIGGRPVAGPEGAFLLYGLIPDTTIALQAELNGRLSAVETISVGPGMQRVGVVLTLP